MRYVLNISDLKKEVQGDPNTLKEQKFQGYLLANLYTFSWSSQLTDELKADNGKIITRVGMGRTKLKPSLELGGFVCNCF